LSEVEVVVSPERVFFTAIPSRKLLTLLKELGLDFEEEVTWCG
jgi:hypothetical protein